MRASTQGVSVDTTELLAADELPRPALLRAMTDGVVFGQVLRRQRVTRAELAAITGISKPTISESVRRLTDAGLLRATGTQGGRRGRVATLYQVPYDAGWVLALEVDQGGVQVIASDLAGRELDRNHRRPGRPGDSAALVRAIRVSVRDSIGARGPRSGPLRAVSMAVANPVDPVTHEIIALPHSPFPEGLLAPAQAFAGLVTAPVLVDNDVNLAALAEHSATTTADASSFAYVYIGAGLGVGIYVGGELLRGAHGLAGEIGYLPTDLTSATPASLAQAFAAHGFARPDTPSNDVPALIAVLDQPAAASRHNKGRKRQLVTDISHAVASVCAVIDPELVLLGGPIGSHSALLDPVRERVAQLTPTPTRIETGTLGRAAPLQGALLRALEHGRTTALSQSGTATPG